MNRSERLSGREVGETLLLLTVLVSFLTFLVGTLFGSSPDAVRLVVKAVAWIKQKPLDEQTYGLTRLTLWGNQFCRFGPVLAACGGVAGLCAAILLVLRRPRNLRETALRALVFFSAFLLAWKFRTLIVLPFSNPLGIQGALVQLRQNPADDPLRYLFIVFVPAVAVVAFDLAWRGRETKAESVPIPAPAMTRTQKLSFIFMIAMLVLLVTGDKYSWHIQVPLDTFHEGETLGPAVHWEFGQSPYKDFVIVHGPFQDPLRSVLAFELFGRSIAASRTMESLLQIVAICLYTLLVMQVLEWNAGLSALAISGLFFFIFPKAPDGIGLAIVHRDITLYLFLFSMISLYRLLNRGRADREQLRALGLFFASSAIPLASFAYSTDRGLYLTIGAALAMVLLWWTFVRRWVPRYLAAIALGALAGVCCLGLSIRWAFPEFLSHVFLKLPLVHGLGFSLPYPFGRMVGVVPLALIALNLTWLVHRFVVERARAPLLRQAAQTWARRNFLEILLQVLGMLFYLSALGRAAECHIYYSSGLVFLLTAVILLRRVAAGALARFAESNSYRYGVGVILVTITVVGSLAAGINPSQWFRFPLGAPDREAIDQNYCGAIAFVKDSVLTRSQFLTMTSEGVWEYFVGRPSPTRFPIVVYALPATFQDEVIRDLEDNRVDFILRRNNFWPTGVDSISFEQRLPLITRYITETFEPYRKFDDQDLWRRKPTAPKSAHRSLEAL